MIINLGEEIGWRGYALPKLQQRFSPLTSSVLLGAAWAAFHWVALAQNPTQPVLYLLAGPSLVAMSVDDLVVRPHQQHHLRGVGPRWRLADVITLGVLHWLQATTPLLAFALTAATLVRSPPRSDWQWGPELGQPAQSNHQTPRSRTASPPLNATLVGDRLGVASSAAEGRASLRQRAGRSRSHVRAQPRAVESARPALPLPVTDWLRVLA